MIADAGVVAGGDGVASLSTLLARLVCEDDDEDECVPCEEAAAAAAAAAATAAFKCDEYLE